MDSSLIISIIVAMVAIIPGVWALVNLANRDKIQTKMDMQRAIQSTSIDISADTLWKKMYEKSVIIHCKHCNSPNVISNLNCTQCGAPIK